MLLFDDAMSVGIIKEYTISSFIGQSEDTLLQELHLPTSFRSEVQPQLRTSRFVATHHKGARTCRRELCPASVVKRSRPKLAVSHALLAVVVGYIVFAPAFYAALAPVVEHVALAPLVITISATLPLVVKGVTTHLGTLRQEGCRWTASDGSSSHHGRESDSEYRVK